MRKTILLVSVLLVLFAVGCVPLTPIVVELETPVNGSSLDSLTPVLAWSCTAASTSYHVQVAEDANFQTLLVDATVITSPSYTIPSGNLSHGYNYYWRVSASSAGRTSGWSSVWSFTTGGGGGGGSAGSIAIYATFDGAPWNGPVVFTINGPIGNSGSAAPGNFMNLPSGAYTLIFSHGGPAGASLASITPSPTQSLQAGGSIIYTLNFHRSSTSSITVSALLDGVPWSGAINYSLHGPYNDSENSVPSNFPGIPPGTYTLSYNGGGPVGAMLTSITPVSTQNLPSGGMTNFTFNFTRQSFGSVVINATLDGAPWSGNVAYNLQGPITDYHGAVPQTYPNMPSGTYTLSYYGGGPSGAMLGSITPSPTQVLQQGANIVYNINFYRQPTAGMVIVNATLDGAPWQIAVGSGTINYTVTGPRTDSSHNVPETFSNMPPGMYTLTYNSGGPIGATLTSISPAPSQNLVSGGSIVFNLNFHGQAKGTVRVDATLNGAPWSGAVGYVVQGPYVESGHSSPQVFSNASAGTYSVMYSSGGPPSAVFEGVTPSTQMLSAGGTIAFTLRFKFQGVIPTPVPEPMPGPIPGPLK